MENTSVQRGLFFTFRLFSLIRPGLRPVHLPRGGRLPPAGGLYFGPSWTCRGPLHTRPCGATLSKQERAGIRRGGKRGHPLQGEGFFEIPRKKPFTFGNTYGRISPLVMASITFVPSAQLREKTQGGISPNPILS